MARTPTIRRSAVRPAPSTRRGGRAARRAFTLLEVIVAVTIVAILAALLVPNVIGILGNAKRRTAQAATSSLRNTVKMYLVDSDDQSLTDGFDLHVLLEGTKPYLTSANDLIDPWGNEYVIMVPGEVNSDFDVISYGADGKPGGEGDAADVHSGGRKSDASASKR